MRKRKGSVIGQAFTLALTAGLILFAGWGFSQANRAQQAYTPDNLIMGPSGGVPANVIRLHIPANSDGKLDQEVKEKIRDQVMAKFGPQLAREEIDVEKAEDILEMALSEISEMATAYLRTRGLSYSAEASIKRVWFPEMTYTLSDRTPVYLAAGEYKALQVKLGEGRGKNWWCVMYPPLCYSDLVQRGILPGVPAASLGSGAGNRDAEGVILVDESRAEEVRVEVRSLILDAIRAGITKVGAALSYMAEAAGSYAIPDMK